MKFPNKIFQYKESVIYDCSVIMSVLNKEMTILELYKSCKNKCNGLQEFLEALVVLYAMEKINYNYNTRKICNVERDNL